MKYFLLVLVLITACTATSGVTDVCRNVAVLDDVVVECLDFGFADDRSEVFVELNHDVSVASYSTDSSSGKCSIDGSIITCPVSGEVDSFLFVEISGVVDVDDQVDEFILEVQLA